MTVGVGALLSGAAMGGSTHGKSAAPDAPAAAMVAENDPAAQPSQGAAAAAEGPSLQLEAASIEDGAAEETLDPYTRIRDLEVRLEQTRSIIAGQKPRVSVNGYIDGGFFVPQGDGAGITRDQGNALFPEYAGKYGWVFLGDIMATAVNSRGEVADLGGATGAPPRFDSIHSGGAPGFIANEINLTLNSGLGGSALATASVNFMPRSGSNFSLGDFMDIDIAQIEWMPTRSQRTSVFFGKTDSLIGIEYRERKSSQRFGITPTLLARYTTGPALGLKVRSKFGPDDLLVVAGAITNGSNTVEQFHFYDELDTNAGKTASGRISVHPPIPVDLELGLSGSYGSQDLARDSRGKMWFAGVDFSAHYQSLDFKAQVLRGAAPGNPADDAYGLELHKGGYAELDWMATPIFGVLGRAELRDAFVWLGDSSSDRGANRAYLTKSWRGVLGGRVVFSERLVFKAEYLRNGEYGGIPEIKNDIFTTSLLLIN
ncbi:MAG TPA: hypothetical protein VFH68_06010 [Polyangia bacterium]|jgi:hypothetical protein|nr:hypothetical protein [Polyangia bacterium]